MTDTFIAVEIIVGSPSDGLLKEGKGVKLNGELPMVTALLLVTALLRSTAELGGLVHVTK